MSETDAICFGTATCRRDVHYARCLLGSIHYFYPENPIVVVCDQDVSAADRRQFASFPNATVYTTAELTTEYKLAFRGTLTDLYYLVLEDHDRYLFCDADSVLAGPVLDLVDGDPSFVAFTGRVVSLASEKDRASFCRYAINLNSPGDLDLSFLSPTPFYFQSSHFLVDRLRFPRSELLDHLHRLDFGVGRTVETPFQRGDQGFLCYVLNKHFLGTDCFQHVPCTLIGTSDIVEEYKVTLDAVLQGLGPYFLHFTGPTRRFRIKSHPAGEVLEHFFRAYRKSSAGFLPFWTDAWRAIGTLGSHVQRKVASR